MTVAEKEKNTKRQPFKQTRDLVRLALNDGWTQKEIAEKCRTQQSVVSAWNKGAKLGSQQQLKPLLNIYGGKLRRNTFRVYWHLDAEKNEKQFFRVEGKIILSQALLNPMRDPRNGKLAKIVPKYRLVIHHQGEDKFIAVCQIRLKIRDKYREDVLACSDENANWNSEIKEQMNTQKLLKFVDDFAFNISKECPSDADTLPFLVRQALLNHSIPVEGIVEYRALW